MRTTGDFLKNFLNVDFSDKILSEYNRNELTRIRMVNYLSVITIANMLLYVVIYSILDFSLFKPAIIFLSLGSLLNVGIIVVNKRGFYNTSKILLAIFTPFYMTVIAWYIFEKAMGFNVYLLLAGVIPVFMWTFKQKGYLMFFISIYLILYILMEFFPSPFQAQIIAPQHYISFFKSSNLVICFMGMGVAIGFYQWFINLKEKQLVKKADELKKLQRHKDIVYSIIAHDLKGPIASFVSLTNYFAMNFDARDTDRLLQIIERMSVTSGSLQTLLENLLDWSKMQSGNLKTNSTDFEVKPLADEALLLHIEASKEKEQDIKIEIEPELKAHADNYMISTIFRNLISNAIKFTPKNGEILINAAIIDDEIQVCVSDTGVGMAQAEMDKLFNIYQIDENHISELNKGGGLGLLICKDFAECNQGKIWVVSEKEKGSKFYFTIPKADSTTKDNL